MRRTEILIGLLIALLAVCSEANERKNQRNFFDFWKSEKAGPASNSEDTSDLFLEGQEEGSGSEKENTKGDDEDYDIAESGDGQTNHNNHHHTDDEDIDSKDKDDLQLPGEKDDEDLFDGSGSGMGLAESEEVVEEEIVTVRVNPAHHEKPNATSGPLSACENLHKSAFAVAQWVPECDISGGFKKLQCMKDKSRCWCVNSNGVEIPGTNKLKARSKSEEPDCEFGENLSTCVFQLVQHSQGLLGAYKPKCTLDGLYEPIQCQESECWCVDGLGNELVGSIKKAPETPNCEEFEETTTMKALGAIIPDSNGGYNIGTEEEPDNTIDVNIEPIDIDIDEDKIEEEEEETNSINDKKSQLGSVISTRNASILSQPGLLAAIIGATVVGLLCIVLVVMFVVYRMRKKDEGSYPLEEQKYPNYQYAKAPEKEFYA